MPFELSTMMAGRKGFDGQVRDLGDGTYIVTRLVWEAWVKNQV